MAIWCALLGNAGIALFTIAVVGWNPAGVHAAARNTARFSSLWCAAALAAPGLNRVLGELAERRLIGAFVAAHSMHLASVAVLLLTFERAHILPHPVQSAAVVAVGSVIILVLALSSEGSQSFARAVRSIALYIASLIFFLAFYRNHVRSLRAIAMFFVVALVLRLSGSFILSVRTRPG